MIARSVVPEKVANIALGARCRIVPSRLNYRSALFLDLDRGNEEEAMKVSTSDKGMLQGNVFHPEQAIGEPLDPIPRSLAADNL